MIESNHSHLTYEGVMASLRRAYDSRARERETRSISDWKIEERVPQVVLSPRRLQDVGSGPGG
jgi:hypothetical protein